MVLWRSCPEVGGAHLRSQVVGTAQRKAALGTADSVYDDLRKIRSVGGFRRAEPDHLKGCLALPRYVALPGDRAFEQARQDLERHMDDYLEKRLTEGAEEKTEVPEARSLQRLLLSRTRLTVAHAAIRTEVGKPCGRNADWVRTAEDDLLRHAAKLFHAKAAETQLPAPQPESERHARLVCLHQIERQYMEMAIAIGPIMSQRLRLMQFEMEPLVAELLAWLAIYDNLDQFVEVTPKRWPREIAALVREIEDGLWPGRLVQRRGWTLMIDPRSELRGICRDVGGMEPNEIKAKVNEELGETVSILTADCLKQAQQYKRGILLAEEISIGHGKLAAIDLRMIYDSIEVLQDPGRRHLLGNPMWLNDLTYLMDRFLG